MQADASKCDLGACLLQDHKQVVYTFRPVTPAECNRAQIEKKMLAIVFATKKFHQCIWQRICFNLNRQQARRINSKEGFL